MKYTDIDLENAHKHCFKNMDEIKESKKCGCFFCMEIYTPNEVKHYITEKDGKKTAQCEYCSIDSVLGDKSGYPITKRFLSEMYDMWFGRTVECRRITLTVSKEE